MNRVCPRVTKKATLLQARSNLDFGDISVRVVELRLGLSLTLFRGIHSDLVIRREEGVESGDEIRVPSEKVLHSIYDSRRVDPENGR